MSFIVYFVDIRLAAIRETRLPKHEPHPEICRLLDCSEFVTVYSPDELTIFSAQHAQRPVWHGLANIQGIPELIVGNIVIAGPHRGGSFQGPHLSINDVAQKIELIRPLLDPVQVPGTEREQEFKIRISRQRPFVQR